MEKILDNNYYDLIISNVSIPLYGNDANITYINERHSILHVPVGNEDPCNLGTYYYHNFPTLYTTTSTISIEKSGIGTVQRNPFLNLTGNGVIIGIIDTGIDYTHKTFLYNDGSTKIISLWDQSIEEGSPPEGFTYGTEYSQEQINLALNSDDPLSLVPSTDKNGHGTAIASIAAGTPIPDQSFTGVVPQANLAVIKLKEAKPNLKNIFFVPENVLCYQETDILLGVRYLLTLSNLLKKPMVILIALGSSQGGHDGNGALSSYLNYLAYLPGIGISISAGNEGNNRRHYFYNTTEEPFYNEFELRIGEKDKLFPMEIWPNALSRLSIHIFTPNQESTQPINPTMNSCRKINFIFTPSTLWVNNFTFEEETGDQFILIRFQDALPGIWKFRISSIENEPMSFHAWLPNGNFITDETFFLNPNPDTTITSPGSSIYPLTVASYNQFNDGILNESSRGYTRNDIIKPDIAAPGFQIPCALPMNRYGTLTGTGASAAHAAGAVAMIMEWAITKGNYATMSGNAINRLIIRGARRNPQNKYPNKVWGYGQLDINDLFQRLTNI